MIKWNVISEKEFKDRSKEVFAQVANALTNTLGPYGSTTIIEQFGQMHITKDGWQVLKKIHFNSQVDENIMQLLLNISSNVVIRVGDGSTSAIVSAHHILNNIEGNELLKSVRPKELMQKITKCVNNINDKILNRSIKFNKDLDPEFDSVYRMALISTNGDEEVSKIIQTVYQQTNNPTIEFVKSKTNKTSFEIIEGYKLPNLSYIDGIYANKEDGSCSVENPIVVMFDHTIDKEHHLDCLILPLIEKAMSENRRLVICAPHYDRYLLQSLSSTVNTNFRARGTYEAIFCKSSLVNKHSHDLYNDFAVLCGATIVREGNMKDLVEGELKIQDFVGGVGEMSICPEHTFIKDFTNKNEHMYQILMNDAKTKFNTKEEQQRELGVVNTEVYELKQRISKLTCKMGVIQVGGLSSLEKTSNHDLVDDAIKACESAFNYGYNLGGNLIIPIVIDDIINDSKDIELNNIEREIYNVLADAFKNVYCRVLQNKYTHWDDDQLMGLANDCTKAMVCHDLIIDDYNEKIINSCMTDIEILKGATSIVSLLVSSNQYISITEQREV